MTEQSPASKQLANLREQAARLGAEVDQHRQEFADLLDDSGSTSEQIEDDFWAAERARDTAARGQHADPGGCNVCKAAVAAGGQVKHDECAQRATLLPAPDTPGWELITGLSEEQVQALPARFHIPVFIESSTPKAWVCAVCWGDGWNTRWPCKTALEQGLRVFTAEDYADTAAKKQAARIAELEKQLAEYEPMNPQQCPKGLHADWLVDSEQTHACPWCRIAELADQLAAEKDRHRESLRHADESDEPGAGEAP